MMPHNLPFILLFAALLAGCAIILLLTVRLCGLRKSLAECREKLARMTSSLEEQASGEFRSSLLEATLKKRLEDGTSGRRTSEKYRYAASLAEQGADAERIAELLQLPLSEVRQLIALRAVGGKRLEASG
jgi:hypothetical protein